MGKLDTTALLIGKLEAERDEKKPPSRALELIAIGWMIGHLLAARGKKTLPPRVMEPPLHRHCLCYVETSYLPDGQPVEVWRSVLIATTCDICRGRDHLIISKGPWYLGRL